MDNTTKQMPLRQYLELFAGVTTEVVVGLLVGEIERSERSR